MNIMGWLSGTKLTTDGEDVINLVKQLGQAVCFSLIDILTVNVRFDSRAAWKVQQPRTVGQSEGGLHAGVCHYWSLTETLREITTDCSLI